MDEIRADGPADSRELFTAAVTHHVPVFSLRYLGVQSEFASQIQRALGHELPAPLTAREISLPGADSGSAILCWRSPTETLLLMGNGHGPELLNTMPAATDGCVVELTGGLSLICCTGRQIAAVFARIGGPGNLPGIGEAKRGRLAELAALALCVRADECQLLIEHYYAEHLLGWIRQAEANLAGTGVAGPG